MTQEEFDNKETDIVYYKGQWYVTGNSGHSLVDLHNLVNHEFMINVLIEDVE